MSNASPGCVVARLAQQAVTETLLNFEQVRVAAAGHQRQRGELHPLAALRRFHQDCVDMAFDMVHGNERKPRRKTQRFGVGHPDEQRADQARPGSDGHGRQIAVAASGALQRLAHHRHDRAQVLPGREFRHHPSILAVGRELGRHNGRQHAGAARDHGRSRFIAGTLDAENAQTAMLSFRTHASL